MGWPKVGAFPQVFVAGGRGAELKDQASIKGGPKQGPPPPAHQFNHCYINPKQPKTC